MSLEFYALQLLQHQKSLPFNYFALFLKILFIFALIYFIFYKFKGVKNV